jgi:hypothetical protein
MTILRDDSNNETPGPLKLNIASIQVATGDGYSDREVLGMSIGSTCTYICNTDATCNGTCCCNSF